MNLPPAKAELRRQIRAHVKNLSADERAAASALLCRRIQEQDFWKQAKTVLLFAPLPDEVDVWPLLVEALAEGRTVALPRSHPSKSHYAGAQVTDWERDVTTGAFGVREPAAHCREVAADKIDLVLVPGMAFDLSGRRLGRGRGYYDRLLANMAGIKCGIAWDGQIVGEILVEKHDIPMDVILTPTRMIKPEA